LPTQTVYTVEDYYDGPRSGVVDYNGHPHFYRSIYLDSPDWTADEDRFELSPVSPDVVAAATEAAEISDRRNRTHPQRAGGPISGIEFGALPEDRNRRARPHSFLASRYAEAVQARRIIDQGEFLRKQRQQASEVTPSVESRDAKADQRLSRGGERRGRLGHDASREAVASQCQAHRSNGNHSRHPRGRLLLGVAGAVEFLRFERFAKLFKALLDAREEASLLDHDGVELIGLFFGMSKGSLDLGKALFQFGGVHSSSSRSAKKSW
jgi:hypothetical protein